MLADILTDSVVDVLKMMPVMFLVCLLGEFIYIKRNFFLKRINSITGIFVSSLFGIIPQCGVSTGFAQLYSKGLIGLFVLMAIFLSSSDEAILVAAGSYDINFVLKLVVSKIAIGIFFGLAIYFFSGENGAEEEAHVFEGEEDQSIIGIVRKTAISVLHISVYIFVTVFILGILIEKAGLSNLQQYVTSLGFFQIIIAAFIGLIPNCASSVFLTQAFLDGVINYSALISGLCANTGLGIIVIFRLMPLNKALKVIFILLLCSITAGGFFWIFSTFSQNSVL